MDVVVAVGHLEGGAGGYFLNKEVLAKVGAIYLNGDSAIGGICLERGYGEVDEIHSAGLGVNCLE